MYLVYVEYLEVVVTPTLGNGTLRNMMKMLAIDSVPPLWKQYCLLSGNHQCASHVETCNTLQKRNRL